ncbi:hypothetical protein [Profundibacter sp.]|uniref:hypothetical protein n=1 Tax=Profundibacter sp. TaxID=3101071 RepID=UPI003D123A51
MKAARLGALRHKGGGKFKCRNRVSFKCSLTPGGTVINKNSFKGMDDFEVVSYLILLGEEADDE